MGISLHTLPGMQFLPSLQGQLAPVRSGFEAVETDIVQILVRGTATAQGVDGLVYRVVGSGMISAVSGVRGERDRPQLNGVTASYS